MTNDKATWERCGLEQYFSDETATDCLACAESDPSAASEALLIAASYIRRGEALPGNLAQFLVEAIEAAMLKPEKFRAKALTDELNLTGNARRPADDWATIGYEVEVLIQQGNTQGNAFGGVAEQYEISEETVKRYWKIYAPAAKAFDDDMQRHIAAIQPNTANNEKG